MIEPQRSKTRVLLGPVVLSYVHLTEKYDPDNTGKGKYACTLLIPKKEKATLEALKAAIEEAKIQGKATKWEGKVPGRLDIALRDGDEKEDPTMHDHWVLVAKTGRRPEVVDRERMPILDPEQIYSGMKALVSITLYPYKVSGNAGVAAALNNVMKTHDGTRLGGGKSAKEDFAGVDVAALDDEWD